MIIKVQLSLATTEDERQILIYNKDRSVEIQTIASSFPETAALLKARSIFKGFFEAEIKRLGDNYAVTIGAEVPDPGW